MKSQRQEEETNQLLKRILKTLEGLQNTPMTAIPVPEMVRIPAGKFTMGAKEDDPEAYDDEQPQRVINLPEYEIGKYPITNGEYAAFVESTGHKPPENWVDGLLPAGKEKHPVTYVSWYDARDYCKWLSQETGQEYYLPTEAQWEKAARGTDGRTYPWGNESPDKTRCNYDTNVGDTSPVGSYPKGASPYGVLDMAGNVWEWTGSEYKEKYEPEQEKA